ncbi:Helix-turn-helix [Desulforamulus aeronauticus DSM 10349]|uniref:Helix-turn-helix n=2 Tax=Desulforamulus aeronauticus TaxID=53343 RepID=A0A1M6SAY1_9FIRM|nr:Helix-turn-helix [Desulforamulus aeronauticus DSM 10349]
MLMTSIMKGRERYIIFRKRNRIRLIDVSRYCGCSASAISQWENNLINLSDELIAKYNEFIEEFEKKHKVRY